jgi:hypothetical protein
MVLVFRPIKIIAANNDQILKIPFGKTDCALVGVCVVHNKCAFGDSHDLTFQRFNLNLFGHQTQQPKTTTEIDPKS